VADFGASLLERRSSECLVFYPDRKTPIFKGGCFRGTLSFSTAAPVAQTLIYMSPEVILTKVFSKAIDMWSLGCILAELKRGVVLFQVCDECELMLEMTKVMNT
jgi:serine/threonine protein kinase